MVPLSIGTKGAAGFIWDPIRQIHGTAALKYNFVTRDWLLLLSPRVDLEGSPGLEMLVMVEYTPAIHGDDWRLYSRVQALYNYDTGLKDHARSYLFTRLGISYRNMTVGVAANFDRFGPQPINELNFGGFLNFALF